jgi:hypothetical protein
MLRAGPLVARRDFAQYRSRRYVKKELGGFDLRGVEGHVASQLLGLGQRREALVGHRDGQFVLDDLDGVADPFFLDAVLLQHGSVDAVGLTQVIALTSSPINDNLRNDLHAGRARCDPLATSRLAARNATAKNLVARHGGMELRPGHSRHRGTVRGVDDHLGLHRLPPGPIGHHDPRHCAAGIGQHIGYQAAEQERHAGVQQRLVQNAFDVQRPIRAVGEDLLGQGIDGLLAWCEPELQPSANVVAQVGSRRGEEHGRTGLGRFDGRCHGSGRSTHHHDVDVVRDGDFSRRLADPRWLAPLFDERWF